MEGRDELFLYVGLDGLVAVVGSRPRHSVVGGSAGKNGEASECGSGSTVAAETSDLHRLPVAGTGEKVSEDSTQRVEIFGNTEVWPVEVRVRPGRIPPLVKVEAEARCVLSDVGIIAQEADTHDRRAVGETHGCAGERAAWAVVGRWHPSLGESLRVLRLRGSRRRRCGRE